MKPRGPLMIEHRLIEKVLAIVRKEAEAISGRKMLDPVFVDTVVDFIRTYADRTHHGKEEDILFKALAAKKLAPAHDAMMRKLVDDHVWARGTVGELVKAKSSFVAGDTGASAIVAAKLIALADFYPRHIRLEDEEFFPATEAYLTPVELDAMLKAFWEFDRAMIHEKYRKLYEMLAKHG